MKPLDVTVIDYGVGNLLSIQRGFEHIGAKVTVSSDPKQIVASTRVVLPGVGSFGNAMQTLGRLGMVDVIYEIAQRNTPLLGICLGMQLLFDQSEEFGLEEGLGLLPGNVVAIPTLSQSGVAHKVPHIGWNALHPTNQPPAWQGTVLQDILPSEAVYFLHSFMALPTDAAHLIADCVYGGHRLPAVVCRDQITGCQFHPEKSGEIGLKIFRRFLSL
jgi:glutamine amidotransferase